jgi:hypothetical protein
MGENNLCVQRIANNDSHLPVAETFSDDRAEKNIVLVHVSFATLQCNTNFMLPTGLDILSVCGSLLCTNTTLSGGSFPEKELH